MGALYLCNVVKKDVCVLVVAGVNGVVLLDLRGRGCSLVWGGYAVGMGCCCCPNPPGMHQHM